MPTDLMTMEVETVRHPGNRVRIQCRGAGSTTRQEPGNPRSRQLGPVRACGRFRGARGRTQADLARKGSNTAKR